MLLIQTQYLSSHHSYTIHKHILENAILRIFPHINMDHTSTYRLTKYNHENQHHYTMYNNLLHIVIILILVMILLLISFFYIIISFPRVSIQLALVISRLMNYVFYIIISSLYIRYRHVLIILLF